MPAKIAFPDTGETVITEYYFSIANVSLRNLSLTLISYPKALVSVVLPKTIPAGQFADGSIKLKDMAMVETFEKSVTFELDDASHTRFTIPITRGFVAPLKPAAKGQTGH